MKLLTSPVSRMRHVLALLTLLAAGLSGSVEASSVVSLIDSVSTSIGSLSDSLQSVSQSSTGNRRVAAGDYKIIEIARVDERPGQQRLHLQADQGDEAWLTLPERSVTLAALQTGHIIRAEERPYGLAFSHSGRAFFLALNDDWYKELKSQAL